MRSVHNVFHELRSERQSEIFAIDVARGFAVCDEQVISARAAGDVERLPQLDVALCTENEGAFVSKCGDAARSQPVHAKVAETAIAVEHHVAEILELRVMAVAHVRHLRHGYFHGGGPGEVDELI